MNLFPHRRVFFQDENINILNRQQIKLEIDVQAKKNAIGSILTHDVRTVNLLVRDALNTENSNGAQNVALLADPLFDVHVPAQIIYCAAILVMSKKIVPIKTTWLKDYSQADSINNGLKTSNSRVIYYCVDITAEPDFQKPVVGDFDENQPALYVANILKYFGNRNSFYSILIRRIKYTSTNLFIIYR